MGEQSYRIGATTAGGMLAVMILLNGRLALMTSPVGSSLIAHFVGIGASWMIWRLVSRQGGILPLSSAAPRWAYWGGAVGAVIVVVVNITVNSPLGLVGTMVMMVLGQTAFALWIDYRGWFGLPQRPVAGQEWVQLALIVVGSLLVIAA